MTFTEILNALAISTGHLNYYLESLGDLITKTEDGKYRLSTFGVAALNLLKDVEEPVSEIRKRKFPLIKIFSVVMCLALLVSAGYVIQYAGYATQYTDRNVRFSRDGPNEPFPVYIEPNQTLVINYTITYNGTWYWGWSRYSSYASLDLNPPANKPELREWDIAAFSIYIKGKGVYFTMKLYTPSGRLDRVYNFTQDTGACQINWGVKEHGTYQVQISNLNSTGVMEFIGIFSFIRWYEYKPFLYLGYAFLNLGYAMIFIVILYPTLMIFRVLSKRIKWD